MTPRPSMMKQKNAIPLVGTMALALLWSTLIAWGADQPYPQPPPAKRSRSAVLPVQPPSSSPYQAALRLSQRGDLRQAEAAAQKAAALSRSQAERYKVAFFLAQVEHKLGNHRAEMEQARRMLVMQPRIPLSVTTVWRAARCNRLKALERRMQEEMHRQDLAIKEPQR
jgi:hypothetical protein